MKILYLIDKKGFPVFPVLYIKSKDCLNARHQHLTNQLYIKKEPFIYKDKGFPIKFYSNSADKLTFYDNLFKSNGRTSPAKNREPQIINASSSSNNENARSNASDI